MTAEEAANRLINAILVEFADSDDECLVPMRNLFSEIAERCSVCDWDSSGIPEWETVGWLRKRSRDGLARLAHGEFIP